MIVERVIVRVRFCARCPGPYKRRLESVRIHERRKLVTRFVQILFFTIIVIIENTHRILPDKIRHYVDSTAVDAVKRRPERHRFLL